MAATTVAWTAGTFAAAFCGDRGQGKKKRAGSKFGQERDIERPQAVDFKL